MLKQLRSKAVMKAVLWAILLLILPAFVLWGTGSLGGGGAKGPANVGTIGGRKISFDNFGQSISSMRCQIILNYYNQSKTLEAILKNKSFIGKLAWDRLIMLNKARSARIKVSDAEVVKFITSHPLFIREGRFDDRVYEYFLKNSLGIYPRNFEELVRENLMIQKVTDSITKDMKISDEEILNNYKKDNAKFRISYTLIRPDDFTGKVKVSDDEIKEFYEKHKQELVVPPKDTEPKDAPKKQASLADVKDTIKSFLLESKARPLAIESAQKTYDNLRGTMDKNKMSFESAATKLGLKVQESKPFLKSEYVADIGEGSEIAGAAVKLKDNEISKPLEVRKGVLIFRLAETLPFDQDTFKKEKDDFAKKALTDKKNTYVEDWLKGLEKGAKLNIDLADYDKYYK